MVAIVTFAVYLILSIVAVAWSIGIMVTGWKTRDMGTWASGSVAVIVVMVAGFCVLFITWKNATGTAPHVEIGATQRAFWYAFGVFLIFVMPVWASVSHRFHGGNYDNR